MTWVSIKIKYYKANVDFPGKIMIFLAKLVFRLES
jgi:hypothetical protein